GAVEVDDLARPVAFYGGLIHDNCPRRAYFDEGKFAKKLSEPYCLFELGCKGPVTHADCPVRLWNSGTNWCVGSGSPCIGCAEPGFPDEVSPFRTLAPLFNVTPPGQMPAIEPEKEEAGFSPALAAGLGVAGGIAAGAAGMAIAKRSAKPEPVEEEEEKE
ncbi:iron hydrogenase, partial [Chloroflexota bacterium]